MTVTEIAEKISEYGGRLYLVGGAVRDMLLGLTPKDYDYCVTGFEKEQFAELFPEAKVQGKSFPVFVIDGNEYVAAIAACLEAYGMAGVPGRFEDFVAPVNILAVVVDTLKHRI